MARAAPLIAVVPEMASEVTISSGAVDLAGWLAVPSVDVPIIDGSLRPALVICHGFPHVTDGGAFANATLPNLADRLAASLGWIVLSFSFRGCAGSGGNFSLAGWLDDIGAALEFLAAEPAVAGLWVAGFGTGGALAVCAAARDVRVTGVATLAAPADFTDWANHPRRLLEFARQVGVVRNRRFPSSLDSWSDELAAVKAVNCAEAISDRELLVIHGSEDHAVPLFDARVIADAHGSAELRIISGAGHDLRVDPRAIATLIGWMDNQWNRFQASLL